MEPKLIIKNNAQSISKCGQSWMSTGDRSCEYSIHSKNSIGSDVTHLKIRREQRLQNKISYISTQKPFQDELRHNVLEKVMVYTLYELYILMSIMRRTIIGKINIFYMIVGRQTLLQIVTTQTHNKLRTNFFQRLNQNFVNVARVCFQTNMRSVNKPGPSRLISIIELIRFNKDIHVGNYSKRSVSELFAGLNAASLTWL